MSDTGGDDSQDSIVLITAWVNEAEKTIEMMHPKWSQIDLIDAVGMFPQGGISLKEVLPYSTEAR